jgi:hypothetical protein
MSTGVRDNITEFMLKSNSKCALKSLDEEGKIPGDESFSRKKAVIQKWGFRKRYDTVSFRLFVRLTYTDFANHQVYFNTSLDLVLHNFTKQISFSKGVLRPLPRGTFSMAAAVAGDNLVDYIERVSKCNQLIISICNRLHATGHRGDPSAFAGWCHCT